MLGPNVLDNMDDVEYVVDEENRVVVISGRIAAATLVPIPAFADVSITLDPEPAMIEEAAAPAGYDSWSAYSASLATFAAQTQERLAAVETLPPASWFEYPDADRLTPLTVTEDGRVFGHIAPWGECHVGLPGCVTAPSSLSGYSHFMVGEQRVQGGGTVPVGTLLSLIHI